MGGERGLIPRHDSLDPVNILLTRYQSVNRERECIEGIEKTRTVGFRVSKLAWTLYDNILNSQEKETLKYLVEGTIIALAKQKLGELPCEQQLQARLAYAAVRASGSPSVSFNINVNIQKAEANPQVNVSIDLKAVVDLVEKLYELRKPLPPVQRKIIEELRAKLKGVN